MLAGEWVSMSGDTLSKCHLSLALFSFFPLETFSPNGQYQNLMMQMKVRSRKEQKGNLRESAQLITGPGSGDICNHDERDCEKEQNALCKLCAI